MELEIKFPLLHEKQYEVYISPARFKVLCCGRRFGKSLLATIMSLEGLIAGNKIGIVSPIYRMAKEISFEKYLTPWIYPINNKIEQYGQDKPFKIDYTNLKIIYKPTGGELYIRSGDKPDSLRGQDYDLLILDEYAYFNKADDLWNKVLRPTLLDREGKALFLSTPNGFNHFYELFKKGINSKEWQSFNFTTYDNPLIDITEIEALKESLSEADIRQEIMAEFTEDGKLFKNIGEVFVNINLEEEKENGELYVGADFGRKKDATVVFIYNKKTNTIIDGIRLQGMPFDEQIANIYYLLDEYRCLYGLLEENSFGMPMVEKIQNKFSQIEGFTQTNIKKKYIIDKLSLAFDEKIIKINKDIYFAKQIREELDKFGIDRRTNVTKYQALEGHDDCVIALALAWEAGNKDNTFYISIL